MSRGLRRLDAGEVDDRCELKAGAGLCTPSRSMAVAMGVALVIVLLSGGDPLAVLRALWVGALGSPSNLAGTLVKSVPMLLTGLSVALAFRAGLFNIGGKGRCTPAPLPLPGWAASGSECRRCCTCPLFCWGRRRPAGSGVRSRDG